MSRCSSVGNSSPPPVIHTYYTHSAHAHTSAFARFGLIACSGPIRPGVRDRCAAAGRKWGKKRGRASKGIYVRVAGVAGARTHFSLSFLRSALYLCFSCYFQRGAKAWISIIFPGKASAGARAGVVTGIAWPGDCLPEPGRSLLLSRDSSDRLARSLMEAAAAPRPSDGVYVLFSWNSALPRPSPV